MHDDFNFKICELEKEMPIDEIKAKLDVWDAPGSYTPLGDRGGRWVPDNWTFPTIYFASNGWTLEIATKDCDMQDVDDYLCKLAQHLGCKIVTEHLEYF